MAATVTTKYNHGAGGGSLGSDVTGGSIRFKRADNDTVDANNPVPKPAAGENLSWSKFSKIDVTVAPAGSITNLRWFTSTPPTNTEVYARTNTTYTQASSSDEAGISSFTDTTPNKTTNASANRTSASPLVVNSGTVLTATTGTGTQDFVQTQMGVSSSYAGGPGATTAVTLTYRYAET